MSEDERRPIFRTLLNPEPVSSVHDNPTVYDPIARTRAEFFGPTDVLLLGPGAEGEFLLLGPGSSEILALGPGIS